MYLFCRVVKFAVSFFISRKRKPRPISRQYNWFNVKTITLCSFNCLSILACLRLCVALLAMNEIVSSCFVYDFACFRRHVWQYLKALACRKTGLHTMKYTATISFPRNLRLPQFSPSIQLVRIPRQLNTIIKGIGQRLILYKPQFLDHCKQSYRG